MGGSADLLLPVSAYTGLSSWAAHQRRNPRSTEPGTDLYVPHGTPVFAPDDGVIWGAGWDINAATGRWVGIDFDNGMGFRCMHHADLVRTRGRVSKGELIAYSGSSGYGSEFFGEPSRNAAFYRNTGGDHTHVTLWPSHSHRFGYDGNGRPYTIDFMNFVGGSPAGGGATPLEDVMNGAQEAKLDSAIKEIGIVRQLLTETEQWKGIGAIVSETLQTVGVIRQLLTETEQWKGIGFLVSETYKTVTSLAAAVAEIASRTDDHEIDPAVIAELRAAVTDLAAISFPTEESIADAVALAEKSARVDELEAELARLRQTTGA